MISAVLLLEDLTMSKSVFNFIKYHAVGQNPCTFVVSRKTGELAGKHEDLESTGKCASEEQAVPSQSREEHLSSSVLAAKKRSCSKGDQLDYTKNRKTLFAPFKNILLVKRPVKHQEPAIYDQKQAVRNQGIAEQLSSCDPVTNRLSSSEFNKSGDSKNKNISVAPSRKTILVNGPIKRPQPAGDDGLKDSVQFQCSSPVQELVTHNESDKTSNEEHSSSSNPVCNKSIINKVECSEGVQDEDIAIEPSKTTTETFKYHCSVCTRRYNSEIKWRHHEKKVHSIVHETGKIKILTCPLCFNNFDKPKMAGHLKTDHGVALTEEYFSYKTYEEFLSWKSNIERETNAFFSKVSSRLNSQKKGFEHFDCHRSGKFVSKGKGKMKIKRHGSKKINAFCPAAIRMRKDKNGDCVVTYQSVHLGHSDEAWHLPLQEEERKYVASKLATGLSLKGILEDIRRDFPRERYQRLHLLNRKDIDHIRKCYGITAPSSRRRPTKVNPSTQQVADQFPTHAGEAAEQSTDGSDDFQLDGDPCETDCEAENLFPEVLPTAPESSASIEKKRRLMATFARLLESASSSELELLVNGILSLDSQLAIYRQEISDAVSGIVGISSAPIPPKKREPVLKRRGVKGRTSPVKKKAKKTPFNNP